LFEGVFRSGRGAIRLSVRSGLPFSPGRFGMDDGAEGAPVR